LYKWIKTNTYRIYCCNGNIIGIIQNEKVSLEGNGILSVNELARDWGGYKTILDKYLLNENIDGKYILPKGEKIDLTQGSCKFTSVITDYDIRYKELVKKVSEKHPIE
jgi:hypothetical protein